MNYLDTCIASENMRQQVNVELIASENFVSPQILSILGSNLTNKYCEGYPEQSAIEQFKIEFPDYVHTGNIGRYYGGCQYFDQIELYARYRFQKLFNTDYHVNVQPHSGSQANQAAYQAVLKPGDAVLSLSLANGGHLTHGSRANFSGKLYNFISYGVDSDGYIDLNNFEEQVFSEKPKLVVLGASAYPRRFEFKLFRNILDRFKAFYKWRPLLMVDMAHIAGLIVAGDHPSPFGYADIITTTTHKTLRGPRGGVIFCTPDLAKYIDSAVFPGCQGGPLMNVIAAKAACADEASTQSFVDYQHNIILNTAFMANKFKELGYELVTGGTDNHLFIIDFSKTHPNISGRQVQEICDLNSITLNKNMVPGDKRTPKETSGVRIGTAAITTKGYTFDQIADVVLKIDQLINSL